VRIVTGDTDNTPYGAAPGFARRGHWREDCWQAGKALRQNVLAWRLPFCSRRPKALDIRQRLVVERR